MSSNVNPPPPSGTTRISVISYPMDEYSKLLDILKDEKTQLLVINRTAKRRMLARKNKVELNSFRCKEILPLSGHRIIVKESGDDCFQFSTDPTNVEGAIDKRNDTRKVELNSKEATLFLASLRLSQLMLKAHYARAPTTEEGGQEVIVLSGALVDLLNTLENYIGGESDRFEVLTSYLALQEYATQRLEQLSDLLKAEGLSESTTWTPTSITDKFELDPFDVTSLKIPILDPDFEQNYVEMASEKAAIDPNEYLTKSPDDEVSSFIKEVLWNSLRSLFSLPNPKSEQQLVEVVQPRISLKIEINEETNPYLAVIELAEKILPAIEGSLDGSEKITADVKKILTHAKEENKISKLITSAPDSLMAQLEELIENNNLESIMTSELSEKISGVLKHEQEESKSVRVIFGETIHLRGRIVSVTNSINRLLSDIESLSSGRDSDSDIADLLPKWKKFLERLATLKTKKQSAEEAEKEINMIQEDLKGLERNLKSKSALISTDESILWLGLGQAGGQILRECLLYALDNLNDARCSALVSALGIKDQTALNENLLNRSSTDPLEVKKAEELLIQECHRNLHVLAMNLGGEIDDLVTPDKPGYFLWGSEIQESENSSVRRKRRNTIKLDIDQDGAGGKTGIGRAFGFARQSEILEALKDVGEKRDRTPKHIIVTHSFAGGSGSGMVLPVLQMLRKLFDSETMIWVISVGQGKSEERESASFNTPFILSDILQAHYDGIHSPMDPFSSGEWEQINWDLKDGYKLMSEELQRLATVIGGIEDDDTFMEYFDKSQYGKKLHERKRSKTNRHRNIAKSLVLKEGCYWQKRSSTAEAEQVFTHDELLDLLPIDEDTTLAFNEWCTEYNLHGRRPSLDFWYDWIDSISDPLGTSLSGILKATKITAGNNQDESNRNFVPSLTGAHLDLILSRLEYTIFPDKESSNPASKEDSKMQELSELEPLKNLFADRLMAVSEGAQREKLFKECQKICQAYSARLDEYNKTRRKLTIRVQALSKSSNDLGIKNIIISNAHLERGVEASGIPVEEKSYTVFNAVVFDFIVNIIGSQLPSHNYISGKMEYFDKQDLSNHTKPPMVVGLLEQNDSLSLEDTVHATKTQNLYKKAQDLFREVFTSEYLTDDYLNPFYAGENARGDALTSPFNSFLGIRMSYLLQHNPYELMSQQEPEKLKELTNFVLEEWSNPELILFSKDFEERLSAKKDLGFSGWNMANMIRWITTIESNTLKGILGKTCNLKQDILNEYCLPSTPRIDLKHARTASSISGFESLSGQVNLEALIEILPKLGVWTEDVLAAHSAAYLNSYLIGPLLKMASKQLTEDGLSEDDIEVAVLSTWAEFDLNPDTSLNSPSGANQDLEGIREIWGSDMLDSNQKQTIEAALNMYDLQVNYEIVDMKPIMTLRLHPRLHRFLNAIRDSVKGPSVSILSSRSMSASISRYLSPDTRNDEIGEFAAPLFTRALDLLNKNRYVGLLPDERFLNWAVFLRILLLGDIKDAETFIDKLQFLARANDIDLEDFREEIDTCLQHQYSKSHFTVYNNPQMICEQASILIKRIVSSKTLATHFGEKYPKFMDSTNEWLRIVQSRWEEGATPNDVEDFDPSSLRYMSHILQIEISRGTHSDEEDKGVGDSNLNKLESRSEGVLQIQRLLFEILTNVNESLTQSEYISKNASTERVRFQMTGFSDRIQGQPSGLLVQVHTDSSYRGNNDDSIEAIRDSIYASIGKVSDSKEFFTKSFFGPRASITTSFQQAPISEASTTFRRVIGHLGGPEPESYLEKTKLHPYVFLYNILWLSAKINVWCKGDNVNFAKNFIIPTKVIEQHYSDPHSLHGSAQSLVTDSVFQGGIEVPRDDLRDFENAEKFGETYRSMGRLIGLMALRHVYADKVKHQKFIGKGEDAQLSQRTFDLLETDSILLKFAKSYRGDTLISPDAKIQKKASDGSALSALKEKLERLKKEKNPTGEDDSGKDTLETRTKAWLLAYKAWYEYSNPPKYDEILEHLVKESSTEKSD